MSDYENVETKPKKRKKDFSLEEDKNFDETNEIFIEKDTESMLYFINTKASIVLNIQDSEQEKARGFYIQIGNFCLTDIQYKLCKEISYYEKKNIIKRLNQKPDIYQTPPKIEVKPKFDKKSSGKVTLIESGKSKKIKK